MKNTKLTIASLLMAFGVAQASPEVIRTAVSLYVPMKENAVISSENRGQSQGLPMEQLWYQNGDEWRSVGLTANQLTDTFQYAGGPELVLFEKLSNQGNAGEAKYSPVIKAQLIPNAKEQLIVSGGLARGKTQRGLSIPIDHAHVPEGNVLSVNLGSEPLALVTELKSQFELNPLKPVSIDLTEKQSQSHKIIGAVQEKDSYNMVYRRVWYVPASKRGVCLLYPSGQGVNSWDSELILL